MNNLRLINFEYYLLQRDKAIERAVVEYPASTYFMIWSISKIILVCKIRNGRQLWRTRSYPFNDVQSPTSRI